MANSLSAKKSARRTKIIDHILTTLRGDTIFRTLDYRRKSESYLKSYMHQPLLAGLVTLHRELAPNASARTAKRRAQAALMWEGDVKTTINNIRFLGVQHRPDFKVLLEGGKLRIAVEIKRGQSGAAVREGIGQSIVYASSGEFEFVVYLFVDVSKDKKVLHSLEDEQHREFIDGLWHNYNVRFGVV